MSRIDPLALAQFMILPGAAELVEAYSAIGPGPMRDSLVHLAQTYAQTEGWSPPVPFGRPGEQGRLPAPKPGKLPSPYAEGLSAKSLEGQIIERLMRGEADHLVADDLGVKLGDLVRLKAKARREGRLVFPGDDGTEAKPGPAWKTSVKKGGKAPGGKSGKVMNLARMPIPDPPYWWEDPNSPVWENPRLLPTYSEVAEGSLAAVGPLDHRNFRAMTAAAERHGLTLRQSIAQRFEILRRVNAGEKPVDIALAMRITPYPIYALLTKVGQGRMGAIMAAQGATEARETGPLPQAVSRPSPPPVNPRKGVRRPPEAAERTTQAIRARAAARWGFANVEAYENMREQIRDARLVGTGRSEIVKQFDMPMDFVKSVIQTWNKAGVEFPPPRYPPRKWVA